MVCARVELKSEIPAPSTPGPLGSFVPPTEEIGKGWKSG